MPSLLATITIEIDPMLRLGPLTLAWHGVATAAGLAVAVAIASRWAARRGLDGDEVLNAAVIATLAGIVGARLLYLAEQDPGDLVRPAAWLGGRGFSIYGAMILGAIAAGAYLRRRRLGLRHLDALAVGFPLGMAVGRLGDLVNGEHYGPPSDLPWAIRYANPAADVPSPQIAYHAGGLYEVLLALVIAPLVWWVAQRWRSPGLALWSVVGLYGAGRFLMFFYRSDSEAVAAGLNAAQWVSLALVAVALAGAWWSERRGGGTRRVRPLRALRGRMFSGPHVMLLALLGATAVAAGCGGERSRSGAIAPAVESGDPGPVHVHGLGVNPRDGALFVATHTGLFRAAEGERASQRVADRYQDTMAFTVTAPDRFLASGHPDGRERLPPYLGLIASSDSGQSWKPVSLQGEIDFHVLEVAGDRIYGFGSDFKSRTERFLVSRDGGRTWTRRAVPEPVLDLAIDPRRPGRLVAAGAERLYRSQDGGRSWTDMAGSPGQLAWTRDGALVAVGDNGDVRVAAGGRSWRVAGTVGEAVTALTADIDGTLYAALHDGTIKRSDDGGRTWTVRCTP